MAHLSRIWLLASVWSEKGHDLSNFPYDVGVKMSRGDWRVKFDLILPNCVITRKNRASVSRLMSTQDRPLLALSWEIGLKIYIVRNRAVKKKWLQIKTPSLFFVH